jgi:hypothetical protein
MRAPTPFPVPRPRVPVPPYAASERFGRYESIPSEVGIADVDTTVITFSGRPDAIYVSARLNAAMVKLSDRLGRETHYFNILAEQSMWLPITRERVIAKNTVGGAIANLMVTGAWAERDDPV